MDHILIEKASSGERCLCRVVAAAVGLPSMLKHVGGWPGTGCLTRQVRSGSSLAWGSELG